MTRKFLRQDTSRHLRLGKKRPKLQRWRRPRGMHSKIRKKRFGYPVFPMVGFKKPSAMQGKIEGKNPVVIGSMKDFDDVRKGDILILSRRIGAKKRMDMMKVANEKGLEIYARGKKK